MTLTSSGWNPSSLPLKAKNWPFPLKFIYGQLFFNRVSTTASKSHTHHKKALASLYRLIWVDESLSFSHINCNSSFVNQIFKFLESIPRAYERVSYIQNNDNNPSSYIYVLIWSTQTWPVPSVLSYLPYLISLAMEWWLRLLNRVRTNRFDYRAFSLSQSGKRPYLTTDNIESPWRISR